MARESAAPVLARLPVAEHALPLVARPVPLAAACPTLLSGVSVSLIDDVSSLLGAT